MNTNSRLTININLNKLQAHSDPRKVGIEVRHIKFNASWYLLVIVAVLGLAFSSSVEALQIKLWDGGLNTVIVADEGIGDAAAGIIGAVTYSGIVGVFIVNVSTGVSKPVIGSAQAPTMDLSSLDISSTIAPAGAFLQVSVTDDDFGPMSPGLTGFKTGIGGTTQGNVTLDAYFDTANQEFQITGPTVTQFAHIGPLFGDKGNAFSGSDLFAGTPSKSPFSITMVTTVIHGSEVKTSSFDANINPTPEPGTILLLGLGLLGLGIISRKKQEIEG